MFKSNVKKFSDSGTSKALNVLTKKISMYSVIIYILWSIVILVSFFWNYYLINEQMVASAHLQAEISYKKDILYRHWNANHGGVYVPVTDKTQPNPYLDVPNKILTTNEGITLTLINPAYMTRQVYELSSEEGNEIGHITSLNPINPVNNPDGWEKENLLLFEEGKKDKHDIYKIEDKVFFRFIKPFITENTCLKCHETQGYKEGDIRGGISISVPMEPLIATSKQQTNSILIGHLIIYILGAISLYFTSKSMHVSNKNQIIAKEKEKKAAEIAGVMVMAGTTAHEINQPLQSILMLSEYTLLNCKKADENYDNLELIAKECQRIGTITKKIQKISLDAKYTTKDYLNDDIIVDIDSVTDSSEN